jgi:hypothetical protein
MAIEQQAHDYTQLMFAVVIKNERTTTMARIYLTPPVS